MFYILQKFSKNILHYFKFIGHIKLRALNCFKLVDKLKLLHRRAFRVYKVKVPRRRFFANFRKSYAKRSTKYDLKLLMNSNRNSSKTVVSKYIRLLRMAKSAVRRYIMPFFF